MSKLLKIVKADSASGRRAVKRLVARGEKVLDARTRRRAERIVRRVKKGGDDALLDAIERYEGHRPSAVAELLLKPSPEDAGWGELPAGFAEALDRAIAAVEAFHRRQVQPGYWMETEGVELVERRAPLERVGAYVPGGLAGYPSTAVMTVIPARLAGVKEIVVVTPAAAYRSRPALRYTLERLGVEEVWGFGGAQAIGALAYGTETVLRVDKIVGPGNAWVTAAKRAVAGDVGIDGLAGPSEVLIVAGAGADPELLAADLLAQAEHDPLAAAVLISDDRRLAKAVAAALETQVVELTSEPTARASLERFGRAILVRGPHEALELIQQLAPEHLQLIGPKAEALAERVTRAGAIFLGASTPEVFGDYVAGPSHVLPTCGSARFASALGVEDFIRRSHSIRLTPTAAAQWAADAAVLAEAEGLPAHAASARRRLAVNTTEEPSQEESA